MKISNDTEVITPREVTPGVWFSVSVQYNEEVPDIEEIFAGKEPVMFSPMDTLIEAKSKMESTVSELVEKAKKKNPDEVGTRDVGFMDNYSIFIMRNESFLACVNMEIIDMRGKTIN